MHAWRPEPLALPAAPAPAPTVRARNAYARRAWPEDPVADASARLL